jgi:hypothetical protein
LPSHGRLLICTDLQGNLRDFQQMVRHFREAGPDGWLVLTGDLVHGPDDATLAAWPEHLGTPYPDQAPELFEAFFEEQTRAPGRVHCLLGNHDHAHIGGPVVSKFHHDEAAALEARLSLAQVTRLRELIRSFPLVAIAPCGAVMLHAAPSSEIRGPQDLESVRIDGYQSMPFQEFCRVPIIGPLLWSRMARPPESAAFLEALGGTVALYGHDVVREGYSHESDDQLCFSTSFGLFDERKVYVELDLAAHYPNVHALRDGIEIKHLW